MKELEKSEKKIKLGKGSGLLIFGILVFSLGYIISNAGESYSLETFVMMYLVGAPMILIGFPIMIHEIYPKFSFNLVLITGIALMIGYGVFWAYTLISH